jgi:hypothetical protein
VSSHTSTESRHAAPYYLASTSCMLASLRPRHGVAVALDSELHLLDSVLCEPVDEKYRDHNSMLSFALGIRPR